MTTTWQVDQFFVGEVGHHLAQAWVWTKEILANVCTALNGQALEFAINGGVEFVQQHTVNIFGEKFVPLGSENDFDDIPSGTTEHSFKFLNDFAVTSHRAIESLQVAVHNKDQVVQMFACGERNRAKGFWFVCFAVTQKCPYATLRCVVYLTALQITIETCVI